MYYVWNNIIGYHDGELRVNLLLNRASAWADIESHLPYSGRVDIKVKEDCRLSVRIPEWVAPEDCECTHDITFDARYAVVGVVHSGETVTLTFPVIETTHKLTIQKQAYTIIRRGNDVVHIDPPGENCPLYQREHMRTDEAPQRKVTRFVADQNVAW